MKFYYKNLEKSPGEIELMITFDGWNFWIVQNAMYTVRSLLPTRSVPFVY